MKQQEKKWNVGTLLTLLLFAIFMVCVMGVLFTGADAYQRLRQRDAASYDRRTAAQYITTKVRQGDAEGMVFTAAFDGTEAQAEGDTLFLTERVDGELYRTRVYCWGGYIRELYTDLSEGFSPEDGEKIMEAEELRFSMEDGCLTATIVYAAGGGEELTLRLRSGEVAP